MNNTSYIEQGYTCVLSKNEVIIFTSREKGIKPLIEVIESNINTQGSFAEDKIVGKAAALLYAYMNVEAVHADVMSKDGLDILKAHKIKASYNILTDKIINRKGDDICPMEKTVADIFESEKAFDALKLKIKQMNMGKA